MVIKPNKKKKNFLIMNLLNIYFQTKLRKENENMMFYSDCDKHKH